MSCPLFGRKCHCSHNSLVVLLLCLQRYDYFYNYPRIFKILSVGAGNSKLVVRLSHCKCLYSQRSDCKSARAGKYRPPPSGDGDGNRIQLTKTSTETLCRFTAPAADIDGGGCNHLRREPQISTTPAAR
jgi:hypothetical protein